MFFSDPLRQLPSQVEPEATAIRKTSPAGHIRCLQSLLYGLGYGGSMAWPTYRADGDYGGGTTRAAAAYLAKGGLEGDGGSISSRLLSQMLVRYQQLRIVRELLTAHEQGSLAATFQDVDKQSALRDLAGEWGVALTSSLPNAADITALVMAADARFGPDWRTSRLEGTPDTEEDEQVAGPTNGYRGGDAWTTVRLKPHQHGVFSYGDELPLDFILGHRDELRSAGMSDSAIRVITPVSANEGNLNAINTYDNCFLTFGMFQWTLGEGSGEGELPALLARLRDEAPEAFERYFGRFGLGTTQTNHTTGFVTLHGQKINTVAEKEQFRARPDWAFRFWRSGLDPRVQLVQVKHALDRINAFWRHPAFRPLGKFFISDLVTSEYGLCLLLDHHVNRPGHLMNFAIGKVDLIGQALKKAALENTDPQQWGTDEERRLIKAYLPLRAASSMTHGADRAKKIKAYLDRGELSDERFSFSLQSTRGLAPPPQPEDYPPVDWEEYEGRDFMSTAFFG